MAADSSDVEDSPPEVKDCTDSAQMQSSQIGVTTFSSWINPSEFGNVSIFPCPCDLSCGITHTISLKT